MIYFVIQEATADHDRLINDLPSHRMKVVSANATFFSSRRERSIFLSTSLPELNRSCKRQGIMDGRL